ncbi:hypothetical protein [Gluconobacter cerinus]|uniref:hypothetical protein n=1 Tax=Gluconobacter cerinus TaxID=38307 RepID=UPI001B8CB643|nr:hypothetical protein [Gluconobacter cerinus]MBS1044476.1 hypothetical protein [Gluconobacter cerinus]
MSTANLAIVGVMLLVGVASALGLYKAGGKSQKADTADQEAENAQDALDRASAMAQAETDKPATELDILARLKKGNA